MEKMTDTNGGDYLAIAVQLRRQPYRLFSHNCLVKSFKFKERCLGIGIETRVVISICLIAGWHLPTIHAWAEVKGERIELARPLDQVNPWGVCDLDLKPVAAIWL